MFATKCTFNNIYFYQSHFSWNLLINYFKEYIKWPNLKIEVGFVACMLIGTGINVFVHIENNHFISANSFVLLRTSMTQCQLSNRCTEWCTLYIYCRQVANFEWQKGGLNVFLLELLFLLLFNLQCT